MQEVPEPDPELFWKYMALTTSELQVIAKSTKKDKKFLVNSILALPQNVRSPTKAKAGQEGNGPAGSGPPAAVRGRFLPSKLPVYP